MTWRSSQPSLQTLTEFITLTVRKPFTLNTTGHQPNSRYLPECECEQEKEESEPLRSHELL